MSPSSYKEPTSVEILGLKKPLPIISKPKAP